MGVRRGSTISSYAGKEKVIIVSLVTAICLLGDSMLYIALPVYWHQVGLVSLWEVGFILSINRFVRLPLNPVIGWLYTKISLRTGLIAAVVLSAVTTIGYGIGQGLWIWLALRCMWGLAWSLLRMGGFFTVIAYAEDRNRGYFMGTYNGLYRLGSLFGMLLGGGLTALIGLKPVAILLGILSLTGVPLILRYVQRPTTAAAANTRTGPASVRGLDWKSAAIWKVIGSGFLISLLFQGVLTSTLSYVIGQHYTQSVFLFGTTVAAATLSGFIQASRWAWEPFLAVKFGAWSDGPKGRRPLLLSFLSIASFGFICIPMAMSVYVWIPILILVMIAATALTTLMDTLTSDAAGRSNAVSLMTSYSVALDFGAASGPLLAYLFLSVEGGLLYTYWGGALILILMTVLWLKEPKTILEKIS